ncbi:oligosaccharide flippase family protein [Hungatella hathewayi]|uniref:oligosaccharide flippase family protein n=1 Tax=Hungatella hathewayi TaxID=154046 RepID=UPI00356401BE
MSREGKLAKNTLIISIGTFLPKLASFITLPILTGYLTQAEYGTYDLITILVSLLLPAATLQIQTAAFRFLIDVRDDEIDIKKIITSITVFIAPTSLIALVVLYFCLFGYSVIIRLFICLYFLVDIVVNTTRQVCRGLNNNLDYSISAILSALGKMVFAVICVRYLRLGLLGTVISLFVSSLFSLIYLLAKTKLYQYIDFRYFNIDKLKEMLKYSWPMVPNSMSAWVMRVSDRFVITIFMGVSANAMYSVANKIPSLLTLAQNTFTMAWQENASIVSKDKDASEYYSSMFRMMFDLMAGIFGLLIAATPVLFKLLIRGNYADAYYQIPILFLGMFFLSISTFLGGIYVAYKESKSVGITTIVAAACNLILDLATIKWIGLYAASGSTLVSYIFLFIYRIIDIQKIVRVKYIRKHIILVLILMVTESILCFQQKRILNMINLIFGCAVFWILNKSFAKIVLQKCFLFLKTLSPKLKKSKIIKKTMEEPIIEVGGDKPFPVLYTDKKFCCGCSACYSICSAGAIRMEADEEGFLYPHVNTNSCICCYKCLNACAFKDDQKAKGYY